MTGTSVGGAVLCGGRSVRFGRDKALIVIDGQPMAERVAGVVESAGCAPVVFAGGNPSGLGAPTGRQRIADTWPGEGPLGAVIDILRWFRHESAEGVVVAACDLPRLSVDAVRAVASEPGAAVAVADRLHPGLAHWPVSAADDLEQLFIGGLRSLHEALRVLGATHVSVPAEALHNVNRPADLAD